MSKIRVPVTVFCQYNPLSASTSGGIGTLIRSFIAKAPEDFGFEVIGVSDDPGALPPLQWHSITISDKQVRFLPLLIDNGKSQVVPLGVRFTHAVHHHRRQLGYAGRVLHFHRPEPALPLLRTPELKFMFIHINVDEYEQAHSGLSRLRSLALGYLNQLAEDTVLPAANQVYAVREHVAKKYRLRYPDAAERIAFMPTWVDRDKFRPLTEAEHRKQRELLAHTYGWSPADPYLVFLGRLEAQKDPLLLLSVLQQIRVIRPEVRLIVIGEGSMRPMLESNIREHGLVANVALMGNVDHRQVANLLGAADVLLLTSQYEGMPVSVLEALACGVPVVAMAVGEVPRILSHGGGELVASHDPVVFAQQVLKVLVAAPTADQCLHTVAPFTAECVLPDIYDTHYKLCGIQPYS